MKKELIDLYKQDEEAAEFIKQHLAEFTEASYNDVTAINPSILRVKDVSIIIKNIHLLKLQKHKNMLQDYFNKMSLDDLTVKYQYKNSDVTKEMISKLKKTIKKRFNKMVDQQLSLELKKVSPTELNKCIREVNFNLTKRNVKLYLVKVKFKNKLVYHYHDEDISYLFNKAEFIVKDLSPLEKEKVKKPLNKYTKDDLSFYYFEQMSRILERYRWVTDDGFFLPKILDDAITQIMTEDSSKKIDELFQ